MASTAPVQIPKAMQAACVALPKGVTSYGKDGYQLPGGFIVFGHGVCVVKDPKDYEAVQKYRGAKRPAEEDADDARAAKSAKATAKAARLVRHLPQVMAYMAEEDASALARLARMAEAVGQGKE